MFDLKREGDKVTTLIKKASFFPYDTGLLKHTATIGTLYNENTYLIHFDDTIAPYVEYLEEGTKPHNIFNAFGKTINSNGTWNYWCPYNDGIAFPFGIGGRFNGRFHPGSIKHKGFISVKCVDAIIDYFVTNYKGELR